MLDYLIPYSEQCNLPILHRLTQERDTWIKRRGLESLRESNALIDQFPQTEWEIIDGVVTIGRDNQLSEEQLINLKHVLKLLIPWRKGPFNFFGVEVNAEWRSDLKWERIAPFIGDIEEKKILDIGCNNGYFLMHLLKKNPELALGIDPVPRCQSQFRFIQQLVNDPRMQFEMWGIEEVPHFKKFFDVVLSMGIIYHHRHPLRQLIDIRESLVSGGQIILESIGIPGEESKALFPEDRYANMRNVWFIPTLSCMENWLKKAKFVDVQVISSTKLTTEEQRLTEWCPPPNQSLEEFLDPQNPELTREGHPAPYRFCLSARKK